MFLVAYMSGGKFPQYYFFMCDNPANITQFINLYSFGEKGIHTLEQAQNAVLKDAKIYNLDRKQGWIDLYKNFPLILKLAVNQLLSNEKRTQLHAYFCDYCGACISPLDVRMQDIINGFTLCPECQHTENILELCAQVVVILENYDSFDSLTEVEQHDLIIGELKKYMPQIDPMIIANAVLSRLHKGEK